MGAWNAKNPETMSKLFAPDGIYSDRLSDCDNLSDLLQQIDLPMNTWSPGPTWRKI